MFRQYQIVTKEDNLKMNIIATVGIQLNFLQPVKGFSGEIKPCG